MGTPTGTSLGSVAAAPADSITAGGLHGAQQTTALAPIIDDQTSNRSNTSQTIALHGADEFRKATQDQRRQRTKVDENNVARILATQVTALRQENKHLSHGQSALGDLYAYQEQLLESLRNALASASLKDGSALHTKTGMLENAECLMGQMFCDGQAPDDHWLR